MKNVIFKHVSIKNFLSVGDDPIDIKFEPGIHIITGVNRDKEDSKNGVGKSTISDAIFFAIFGSPLRPIKKDVITNWINKKECSVTISFDVINDGVTSEYILLRSLNPSRTQLIKNGEDVSRTIGKTNETIHEILGTTSDMFEQSVIMCLNQHEPFLAKTPAVKRKFIEDIFKIEIFGRMTQYMRNDFNETKRLCDTEKEKAADLQANIQVYKRQQADQAEKRKHRLNDLEGRKASILEEISHTKTKREEALAKTVSTEGATKEQLQQQIVDLRAKEKEVIELDKQYAKVSATNQTTVVNLKSRISELERLTDGVCAYCKQPFSAANIQEKQDLISKFKTQIAECDKALIETESKSVAIQKAKENIEDLITEISQKKRAIEMQESEISKLDSEIRQHEGWLAQVEKDIESANKDTDSFESVISELTARFTTLSETVAVYENKLSIIDTSKFIVSDEGVKNFIVKKMLKMLNGRLNYYLKELDANCSCSFNEYFDETIINNRGRECSYFNFSGGERKRIDLAMLFTFMDIRRLQSNIFVNIAIYDELLDTSLDSIGIERTLNILKKRVLDNNEAIYVISHKNEAAKHATGEIIYLEKMNDITRRKPYDQFLTGSTVPAS
jgi:DNA repair exonuclease SbcCD ATPase subunit